MRERAREKERARESARARERESERERAKERASERARDREREREGEGERESSRLKAINQSKADQRAACLALLRYIVGWDAEIKFQIYRYFTVLIKECFVIKFSEVPLPFSPEEEAEAERPPPPPIPPPLRRRFTLLPPRVLRH